MIEIQRASDQSWIKSTMLTGNIMQKGQAQTYRGRDGLLIESTRAKSDDRTTLV